VTGRTLNEHEHVDKQIFEILERAQVREKSRRFIEQQFTSKNIHEGGIDLIERCKMEWAAGS
jgi:hypothetical protein